MSGDRAAVGRCLTSVKTVIRPTRDSIVTDDELERKKERSQSLVISGMVLICGDNPRIKFPLEKYINYPGLKSLFASCFSCQ